MLRILKAKMERAEQQEKLARLVSLRQPDKPAPGQQEWINAARSLAWNGKQCPPENLLAVVAVESGGAAFNAEGRLVIAYEPHVFSRNSGGAHDKAHPRVSYRRFKNVRTAPPNDFHPMRLSQLGRWELLIEACALDFNAGTSAASYGMWQILGEGARPMGFADPMHMIEIMYQGYDGQFECFVRFCKWKRCLEALVTADWDKFERLYNGGGQNGAYARKLRAETINARRMVA